MNAASGKNLIFTFLLMIGLVVSFWLARDLLSPAAAEQGKEANTPDSYMNDVHYVQYDNQGHWQSTLDVKHMVHYSQQDTAKLEQPRLISTGKDKLIWIITADHGISHDGGKVLDLQGHVVVQRLDNGTQKTMQLNTESLVAYPKKKYAETNQPVTITQPGSVMKAIGMTADMNTGDIKLLNQAQGVYEPTQAKPNSKPH